jgi:hypothetical protein
LNIVNVKLKSEDYDFVIREFAICRRRRRIILRRIIGVELDISSG